MSRSSGGLRLFPISLSLPLIGLLAVCGARAMPVGPSTGYVCMYEDARFGGRAYCLSDKPTPTPNIHANVPSDWLKRISSVRMPAGYKLQMFADSDQGGRSITLNGDASFLGDVDFNDVAASLVITPPPVSLASVQFAQSMVRDSADPELTLVADKATLLKVDVTGPAGIAVPRVVVDVRNRGDGTHRRLRMTPPMGHLPTTVSKTQSFADAYTVSIPPELVKKGLEIKVWVSGAMPKSFSPRVGPAIPLRIVQVPVRIREATDPWRSRHVGQLPPDFSAYLLARFPVSSVTLHRHPVHESASVTRMPSSSAEATEAFAKILGELNDLRLIEGGRDSDHYLGFAPGLDQSGLGGMGHLPGRTVVVPDNVGATGEVGRMVAHELGHNLSLRHAPCGAVDELEPDFPYPNGNLGKPGHHVWSYLSDVNEFYDPRPSDRYDLMSYCSANVFSDDSDRRMRGYLAARHGPALRLRLGRAVRASDRDVSTAVQTVQDVMLIGGSVLGDQVEFRPVKTFRGRPDPAGGSYTLRVQTTAGDILDQAFTPRALSHGPGHQHFSVLMPKVENIHSISVLRAGAVLAQRSTSAQAPGGRQKRSASGIGDPQVAVSGVEGRTTLRWDALAMPYLTVTWTDGTDRLTLAQDLRGGDATLSTQELPSGGRFEFILSDGLNARRTETPR